MSFVLNTSLPLALREVLYNENISKRSVYIKQSSWPMAIPVKMKIRPSIHIVCGARQAAARWQHIARYSQCILFTARIYVCRYISEQKATFGRLAAAERRQVYGGGGRPTHTATVSSHTCAPRRVRAYRTSERAKQPPRRILIIMKGETLFVGQELNLYYCR